MKNLLILAVCGLAAGVSAAVLEPPSRVGIWGGGQDPLLPSCTAPVKSSPTAFWLDQQDHTGPPRGYAPFIPNYYTYPVYRNVLNYGTKNDGSGDQTAALQQALNDDGRGGNRYQQGWTYEPAELFLPSGIYTIGSKLDLRMGTIIVGDPINPPIIRAAPNFSDGTVVNGYDFATGHPEDSFMTLMKNVIIDTTLVDKDRSLIALAWGVAQGCGLTNVQIDMPTNSNGHVGISLDGGSTISLSDVQITGGAIGIRNTNQQVAFKDIYFKFCTTAYQFNGGFTSLLQGAIFDTCGLGADLSHGGAGSLVILDSKSINSGPVVKFHDASHDNGPRNNQIVIENLSHDNSNPIAIESSGRILLGATSSIDTWVWGNAAPDPFQTGSTYTTVRPSSLLLGGNYFTKQQPTYKEYSSDQFVNVKAVPGYPVKGDGSTDDSASLNAILAQNAANCKISYFPYGVYIVENTLLVPVGSRLVGEAWPVISGKGDTFKSSSNPVPIVKVGNVGDQGVAEISEFRFTVAEVLPGATILEVNMAGSSPGDVGIWNSVVTIGGTRDTTVATSCQNQDTADCMAAFMAMHLTSSSSAYVENLWAWTADHDVDGGPTQNIATGRGILVEATHGTWLIGTGSEHHWLYNYNFNNAQNVFTALQQSETPYMQGLNAIETVPAPWVADGRFGDPDYSWCGGGDQRCRTALSSNINGGSNLMLYNAAAWAFFNGPWSGDYSHQCDVNCQVNMIRVAGNPNNLVWYGINTKSADVMVMDGKGNPSEFNNPGSWGGNLVAYRQFAASSNSSSEDWVEMEL